MCATHLPPQIRGSSNMVLKKLERGENINGLITASAGNHAQGVSLVAKKAMLPCSVVCPEWAPDTKLSAVKQYGAGACGVNCRGPLCVSVSVCVCLCVSVFACAVYLCCRCMCVRAGRFAWIVCGVWCVAARLCCGFVSCCVCVRVGCLPLSLSIRVVCPVMHTPFSCVCACGCVHVCVLSRSYPAQR